MRLNLLAALLLSALCLLQYRLWFESGGIWDVLQLKKSLTAQIKDNEKLKHHNEMLLFQVKRLQESDEAAESRARNDLNMIKKGEIFYQVIKPTPHAQLNRKEGNALKQPANTASKGIV